VSIKKSASDQLQKNLEEHKERIVIIRNGDQLDQPVVRGEARKGGEGSGPDTGTNSWTKVDSKGS